MKMIELTFEGYWTEVNKGSVPSKSGVYCVYACSFNTSENTVSIRELVYVGESGDVNLRIASHERLDDWKTHLISGETLCYSFAAITSPDRERAEAAIIYKHKPPQNTQYVYSFPFNTTTMKLLDKNVLLVSEFTVYG